jgi:cell shape-determining protein MreC
MSFLTNYRKKKEAEMEKPSLIEETIEKLEKITEERDNLKQKVKEYEHVADETEQLKKEKTQLHVHIL